MWEGDEEQIVASIVKVRPPSKDLHNAHNSYKQQTLDAYDVLQITCFQCKPTHL